MRIRHYLDVLFQRRLGVLCCATLIAITPATFFWSDFSLLGSYWALGIAAISVIALRLPTPSRHGPYWQPLACLAVLAVCLKVYFTNLAVVPLGMDEDLLTGWVLRHRDLVRVAASAQQPPLFYYVYRSFLLLTEVTLGSIRTLPAFFTCISAPLLFSLLQRLGAGPLISLGTTALLAFDPQVLSLGRELRAYTMGMFFFLIYLHGICDYTEDAPGPRRILRLSVANFLFLASLGAQPILMSTACAVSFATFFRRSRPTDRFGPLAAFVLAFLLFAPIQWVISGTYGEYLSREVLMPWAALTKGASSFLGMAPLWLGPLASSLVLVAAGLALSPFIETSALRTVFVLLPLVSLPSYLYLLGGLVGGYMQQPRYLLLLKVSVVVAIGMSATLVAQLAGRFRHLAAGLYLAAALSAIWHSVPARFGDPRWTAFYDFLEASNIEHAAGLMFSVAPSDVLEFSGFVGLDFYYKQKLKMKAHLESAWNVIGERSQAAAILRMLERHEEPRELLLFDPNLPGGKRIDSYRLNGVLETAELLPGSPNPPVVIRIANDGGIAGTLERILNDIDRQEKAEPLKFRVYLQLAGIRAFQGKCEEAKRFYSRAYGIPGISARRHDHYYERRLIEKCKEHG